MNDCIICDIDGTLALRTGRGPYDTSRYHEDVVCKAVKYILDAIYYQHDMDYNINTHIIIVSGRSQDFKEVTRKRLEDNNIIYHHLYMRPSGDTRHDYEVKEEIYNTHIKDKYNVLFALDDRTRLVDMRRSLGIYTFDCNQTREVF